MIELIEAAFSPVNVVFTGLLLLVVVYWVLMIIGALDIDFLNVDADVHVDADVDADMDVHSQADIEAGGVEVGFLRSILQFFYVGKVPIMVLISVLSLSLWTISMIANHVLNPMGIGWFGLVISVANIVLSLMILKALAVPLKGVFKHFHDDPNRSKPVIGSLGRVITGDVTSERMGQVEIATKGAPTILNAMTAEGEVLHKGDEAVVLERDSKSGVYIVASVELDK